MNHAFRSFVAAAAVLAGFPGAPFPVLAESSGPQASCIVIADKGGAQAYATVTDGERDVEGASLNVSGVPLDYGVPVDFLAYEGKLRVSFVLPLYHADLSGQVDAGRPLSFQAILGGKPIFERKDVTMPEFVRLLEASKSPFEPRVARARWTPVAGALDYVFERTDDPAEAMQVLALAGDVDLMEDEAVSSFLVATLDRKAGEPEPMAAAEASGPGSRDARAVENLRLVAEKDEVVHGYRFRVHRNDPMQIQNPGTIHVNLKLHSGVSAAFVQGFDMNGNSIFLWKKVRKGKGKKYHVSFNVPPGAIVLIGRKNTSLRGAQYQY